MKNAITLVVFILVITPIGSTTAWQPSPEIITIEAAGQTHYIRSAYGADDPFLENVSDYLFNAIVTYDALWDPIIDGVSPIIFFDLEPEMPLALPDGRIPDGSATPISHDTLMLAGIELEGVIPGEPVCYVQILAPGGGYPLDYAVAHETAHCYQFFNIDAFDAFSSGGNWWIEGSAQWLSSLVYSLPDGIVSSMHFDFQSHMQQPLLIHAYDAYYFWHFFSEWAGSEAVINFLDEMPASDSEHLDYLNTHLGSDGETMFHDYVRAVAGGGLPYTPDFSAIAGFEMPSELPAVVELTSEPYGIGLMQMIVPVEPDQKLLVDVVSLTESGLRVSLLAGSEWIELEEGTPIEVCGSEGLFTIAWSRAGGGIESSPPEAAQLTVNESTEPCDPTPAEEVIPDCMVGTWDIDSFTGVAGAEGYKYYTINADGSVEVEADFAQELGQVSTAITGSATQQITLDAEGRVTIVSEEAYANVTVTDATGRSYSYETTNPEQIDLQLKPDSILGCGEDGSLLITWPQFPSRAIPYYRVSE